MTAEELGNMPSFSIAGGPGLTKREYMVTELAAALILINGFNTHAAVLATTSIEYTDHLLAKLAGESS
jgi:hypothetical protein